MLNWIKHIVNEATNMKSYEIIPGVSSLMNFFVFLHFQILPVAFGIAAVLTVALAAHFYFSKSSKDGKKKKLTTLQGPTTKVLLPLIEKEEISHDTKREYSWELWYLNGVRVLKHL